MSSSSSSRPLLSWDDRVLSGLPWPEELTLSLPEEKIFEGFSLPPLEPPLLTLLGNLGESSVDHSLKGTVPTVTGAVYDLPGVGMVNLAHLQVFSREEFDAPDRYIKAGEELCPCREMEAYVIHRDDRYVVLDMTGFVITRPFPESWRKPKPASGGISPTCRPPGTGAGAVCPGPSPDRKAKGREAGFRLPAPFVRC